MKRTICIIITALLLLPLAACQKGGQGTGPTAAPGGNGQYGDRTYNPETDVDNRYANAFCSIVELDNMFLWQRDSMLMFYDKVADYGDVFCSKPECDHSPDNAGCNGGMLTKPPINYYEGKFYYLASWSNDADKRWYVFSMNTDSTGREVFMTVPWYEDGSMTLMRMFIHRGKVYFVNEYDSVEGGKTMEKYSLLSCDFETHNGDELKPVIEFESDGWYLSSIFFAGDDIYLMATPAYSGQYYLKIWKYDTLADETTVVAEMEIDDYFTPMEFWVMQNGDILIGEAAATLDQNVKVYKVVDNALEVYMDFGEGDPAWTACSINEETITAHRIISERPRKDEVWIKDHEGNTIFQGILSTEYCDGLTNYYFGGSTYFGASRDRILRCVEYNREQDGTVKEMKIFFIEYDITEDGLIEKTLAQFGYKMAG